LVNLNSGLRPNLCLRLNFGLSLWSQRKTNSESEIAQCEHVYLYYTSCGRVFILTILFVVLFPSLFSLTDSDHAECLSSIVIFSTAAVIVAFLLFSVFVLFVFVSFPLRLLRIK